MAKARFTTNKVKLVKLGQPELARFAEARVNQGVITMIDPADIPNGALLRGKNIVVRNDRTSRREGNIAMDPSGPDALPVLAWAFIKLKDGTVYTIRFTHDSLHNLSGGVFTPLTGTLAGTATDRIQLTNVLNTIIFANNGANNLQKLDLVGGTFTDLGNAPAYRYVTSFYNRAVGAALRGVDETQVGWSADGDPEEWDQGTDQSAGSAPVLDSPGDLSDHIKGIFGFTGNMILLRENSIWIATRKAIETDPFHFVNVFPGLGCDIPSSVAVIPNGIAWADTRSGSIWSFTPGEAPVQIGAAIEDEIFRGFSDPTSIFSGYKKKRREYTIAIPRAGSSLVTTWTYSFITKAWWEGEYSQISCVSDIELIVGDNPILNPLMIDDLVGMIDDLVGTIDQLVATAGSGAETVANVRLFGRTDGETLIEHPDAVDDAFGSFETLIDSKIFQLPTDDEYIGELRLEFLKHKTGTIELYYSKDNGKTFTLHRTVTNSQLSIGKGTIVKAIGPLNQRTYVWRVRATTGAFDILSFEILTGKSAKSVTGS